MSAHIPPCVVDTNGGDCSCAETWKERYEAAMKAFDDLDSYIDTASRWYNDSTQWNDEDEDGGGYLAPIYNEIRERVSALHRAAQVSSPTPKEGT